MVIYTTALGLYGGYFLPLFRQKATKHDKEVTVTPPTLPYAWATVLSRRVCTSHTLKTSQRSVEGIVYLRCYLQNFPITQFFFLSDFAQFVQLFCLFVGACIHPSVCPFLLNSFKYSLVIFYPFHSFIRSQTDSQPANHSFMRATSFSDIYAG